MYVVLQFERMDAIQMEKHKETAFLVYFILLLLLVITSLELDMNIVNLVYLVVVLSCSLKFILIVNKSRK